MQKYDKQLLSYELERGGMPPKPQARVKRKRGVPK
jgi:hypothetical protein